MDKSAGQNRAASTLYSPIQPFDQKMIDVGDGHLVYVEQSGNPKGIPILVLHGGPGGGCNPYMRRFFDPESFHIILFDQRGCGKSKPFASVSNNTTWDLIADIEKIRRDLQIEKWSLFGGSWGSTLSLLYAEAYPNRVVNMILRGIFLMTKEELDWFYGGGAGKFFPENWEKFKKLIPNSEQSNLIAAYHKRLFSNDLNTERKFSGVWAGWEAALAVFGSEKLVSEDLSDYSRAFSRIECHYFFNNGFLKSNNQILENLKTIEHIPATIIQGRYDFVCPPSSAYRLVKSWEKAELKIVNHAGHAMSEPGISKELIRSTNNLRDRALTP